MVRCVGNGSSVTDGDRVIFIMMMGVSVGRSCEGLVDHAHNGVRLRVNKGVIPQSVVVFRHRVTFCTAGMMAVGHQAGDDAGGLMTDGGTIPVQCVKEYVLTFGGRNNKSAPVTEGVKFPIISVVVLTQKVEPGK